MPEKVTMKEQQQQHEGVAVGGVEADSKQKINKSITSSELTTPPPPPETDAQEQTTKSSAAVGSCNNNGNNDDKNSELDELTQKVTGLSVEEKATQETASEKEKEEEEAVEEAKVSPPLQALASWIQDEKCERILVVSGAGVSVASGIPDFRTKETGLYDNLQKYNLPYPEAIFDVEYYQNRPEAFVALASEIWPGVKYAPTLTHSFIALLAQKGLLLRNYSQNIDGLEFLANIPTEFLVECHGHFRSASCVRCHTPADAQQVKESMVVHREAPSCDKCGSFVKPDIVFFGEGLPDRFHRLLRRDMHMADLVLVLGTSLQVAPVSHIPDMVSGNCKRALINRELVGSFAYTCDETYENDQDVTSKRDVFVGGDCDDSILQLARILGWEKELQEMHRDAELSFREKQKSEEASSTSASTL